MFKSHPWTLLRSWRSQHFMEEFHAAKAGTPKKTDEEVAQLFKEQCVRKMQFLKSHTKAIFDMMDKDRSGTIR